jgi:hypothetical protein
MYLDFSVEPDNLIMPYIEPKQDTHRLVNESFRLKCLVKVEAYTRPLMKWTYVTKEKGVIYSNIYSTVL